MGDVHGGSWSLVSVTGTWPLAIEVQGAFVAGFWGMAKGRVESWPLNSLVE